MVDLETTGGSPASCEITEIGAVKVRGGEIIGEFATLVRPSTTIPPFIAVLTGITDAMVASSPGLASVLPAFLEFAAAAFWSLTTHPSIWAFSKRAVPGSRSNGPASRRSTPRCWPAES